MFDQPEGIDPDETIIIDDVSRLKNEFLALINHELRTPLNGIVGFAEMLAVEEPERLSDKQKVLIGRILDKATQMEQLVQDLLSQARITAGEVVLQEIPCDLRRMLDDIEGDVEKRLAEKQLSFYKIVDPNFPPEIMADPFYLRQVLTHLVSNALKFTAEGSITVHVMQSSEEQWQLTISDTGIGISEADQEIIFLPFQQVDLSVTRRYGGTGLGLALVRQLVRLMGGEIHLNSQVGQGSTFFITLPITAKQ